MQQHAFLHRCQRVDIFDLPGRYRQAVELALGHLRQGEVRWRQAARLVRQAVLDQALQLIEVGLGQGGDSLTIMPFAAERPAQHQLATADLAVDAQLIGQRRIGIVDRAQRRIQRLEQRILTQGLVELAQVVEGDRRARQVGHRLASRRVGHVAQYAMA